MKGVELIAKDSVRSLRDLILIYSAAGNGKTRLATSLTERFGRIAYIALDEGSENLDSVLAKYHDRIDVFRPKWKNPIVEAFEIAENDWKAEGYDTIIIDTFTNLSWNLLFYVTNQGMFQKNHVMIGDIGKPGRMAMPDKGDYGGVQGIIRNFVTTIFKQNPEMNIIFVCHQATDDESALGAIGGPATVGRALIEWLPARFKTVIRLDRKLLKGTGDDGALTQEVKLLARTAQHGAWLARLNENSETGNPLPSTELEIDPVNFWEKYDKVKTQKDTTTYE